MSSIDKYNEKRNFDRTVEPKGKIEKSIKNRFVVQHHIASHDHYDFRLEYNGILLSWAVPKGPSHNTKDKRLAVQVEDHPLSYRNFEGVIPKGEYGAGIVMLWDRGTYNMIKPFKETLKKDYLKFELKGKKLKGKWTLKKFKDDNWLLIKEKDNIKIYNDINELNRSVKSNKTMEELENKDEINLTSPDKVLYKKYKVTKKDIMDYYKKVVDYMLPYVKNRFLSVVRTPKGTDKETFFKKHFQENKYLAKKGNYYYIKDNLGLLSEVQMCSIEFHVGGSKIDKLNYPNIMVFDLDPDEKLSIKKVREGVKDLKKILDELNLKSYLKTSGGKGYHVVIPIKEKMTWKKFQKIAIDIAKLMEVKYPDKYTTKISKKERTNKIFIDYLRNKKSATSVAPYSLRARDKASVSMPIKWSELDKVKPDEITIKEAIRRLKRKNPWENFFE